MAGVYYPVINIPRTRAPRRGLINIRRGVAGLATYVESPAYQGSNGLGADATAASISQAAVQAAAQIAQQRFGNRPAVNTVIQQLPYANPAAPAPTHRWLPWVIGGGAVFLLAGVGAVALRRRRK